MTTTKPKGRTVADFRASHDPEVVISNKITAALAGMLKEGPEHWETEAEVAKRAKIGLNVIAKYREQFSKYVVETPQLDGRRPQKIWFADPAIAKRTRGE